MDIPIVGAFLAYCAINVFTPGPGNILALSTAASHGWKRGLPLCLGIFCGYFVVQGICALLVFWLGSNVPNILWILKYIGVAYIIWLAIHIAKSTYSDSASQSNTSFTQGFLLQFVNVKIYLFGVTALVGFVVGYSTDLSVLLITEIFIAAIGTIATLVWIGFGVTIQRVYQKHFKKANLIFALSLIVCAAEMLI